MAQKEPGCDERSSRRLKSQEWAWDKEVAVEDGATVQPHVKSGRAADTRSDPF
jgi:hypothetical protein